MRKKIAVILSFILICALSLAGVLSHGKAQAKKAQIDLVIPDAIEKENEFTVKVVVDSDIDLYSIDAYLSYDSNMLEFVPDNEAVTGTSGILEIKDIYGEKTKKAEYEITFRAMETGNTELALTDVYLIDYTDLDHIEVSSKKEQLEIGINRQVAGDASLQELLVAPGDLTEEFSPDCLEYEVHVGLDVEMIGVSAIPADEDSVVELDMPEQLAEGENLVVITVTALSGNVKTYTIRVIRQEWPEEAITEAEVPEGTEIQERTETQERTEPKTETPEGMEPAAEEPEVTETEMPEESETTEESLTASEIE